MSPRLATGSTTAPRACDNVAGNSLLLGNGWRAAAAIRPGTRRLMEVQAEKLWAASARGAHLEYAFRSRDRQIGRLPIWRTEA